MTGAWTFARHYLEMVVVMLIGMVVLGAPAAVALDAIGVDLHDDAPALMVLGMAWTMTVPMVGWMALRGHGRQACVEMSLAMFVPAFGVVGLMGAGAVGDMGVIMTLEHTAMFLAMLGAMLLRRAEYGGHDHRVGVAS
jgi:hypothetical protein